jgi:hypothetical protein
VQHGSLGLFAAFILTCATADRVNAQQDPKDIIAAQIRSQGYSCNQPTSATRDSQASKPYGAVWILVCENGSYRVTLVPNLAAKVETIDASSSGGAPQ